MIGNFKFKMKIFLFDKYLLVIIRIYDCGSLLINNTRARTVDDVGKSKRSNDHI